MLLRMSRLLYMTVMLSVIAFMPGASFGQTGDGDKLDPTLKMLVADPSLVQTAAFKPLAKVTQDQSAIDVFIRTTNGSSNFGLPGVQVKATIGNIVVASLPIDILLDLAARSNIRAIQSANVWKTRIDQSVPATNTLQVRSAYRVRGKGVIVGVIDTGIDPGHLDFRSLADDTRTRILYFWDMSNDNGLPPKGFEGAGGTELDSTAINQQLRTGAPFTTHGDFNGHGTHVAGTAAGNGGGTQYIGMAPEADLIVVKATRDFNGGSFSSGDIITALKYIDTKAAALGKPYVVNMSLGAVAGPADGSDAESIAIDTIFGPGKPGKAVVVAAGNDGELRIHARATLSADPTESVSKRIDVPFANVPFNVQIWSQIDPNDINKVFISVTGPDTTFGPVSGFPLVNKEQRDGVITVVSSPHPYVYSGTDIQTGVGITPFIAGEWTISVRGDKGAGAGVVDMWLLNLSPLGSAFMEEDGDQLFLTGQPASAENAITVGSYVTKTNWINAQGLAQSRLTTPIGSASAFSSPGPSRDGRVKPEISAPGEAIASAKATFSDPHPDNILSNGRYAMLWGTSMATPHVAGAVALVFEEAMNRGVSLDAIQVRDALQTSAISDEDTGPAPSDKWGYGKMDVEGMFTELFGQPLAITLASFIGDMDGRRVYLSWEITEAADHAGFHVYRSSTGRTADRLQLTPALITGGPHLTFVDLPQDPGVYYYWLADVDNAGQTTFHGPIVITMPAVPSSFRLGQNSPNPFNPTTTIEYDLPGTEHVIIRIYDTLGREVQTLVNERLPAGFHQAVWNGRDHRGIAVGSGVYFYALIAGDFAQSHKMTLLK